MDYDFRNPTAPVYRPGGGAAASFYPRVGQPGQPGPPPASRAPYLHPPPAPTSSGLGIRVAIKPEYRITPPPQLAPQMAEVPRSTFQFDFDFEKKILAEAEQESQNWSRIAVENCPSKPTASSSTGSAGDPVVNKYVASGLGREAVSLAVLNYGDNPVKCVSDASTQCSKVDSECVMDYTSVFTTYEIFKSREAMIMWTRDTGRTHGFVVVIKSSVAGAPGKKPRVTFACERSGEYRPMSKKKEETSTRTRTTGSKKCGCPFSLKGKKLPNEDDWMLHVECGLHNHPNAENLEGHSYAGRLSKEEHAMLVDMSKSMVRPKDILTTLKQKDPLNVTTMKTIYNARQRYRAIEKAGRSQM